MTWSYEDALERALSAARDAGADDVEVSYTGAHLHFTRFASSRFTQVGEVSTHHLRVRVLAGGRLGTRRCDSLAPEAVTSAARAAIDAARSAPPLGLPLAFAAPGEPLPDIEPPAPIPEPLLPSHAPSTLMAAFSAVRPAVCFGSLKILRRALAVRTLAGVRRDAATALIDAQLIAQADGSSGFAGRAARPSDPLDLRAIASDAADRAARGKNPTAVDPGPLDVVLAPEAVAELLEWMSMASFGAQSVLDGTSLLAGRAGKPLFDARIAVHDAPGDGEVPFDAEGSPRKPVTFIDAGRAGSPVTDRLTALRLSDARGSTGHAPPIEDDHAPGPMPMHVSLAPGDATEDELIAGIDRGLYVTRLHYVNGLLDTRRAVTTGMTRDGTFLIEGGVLGRGVRNLRFTDALVDAWGPRLMRVGRQLRDVPTWWSPGGIVSVPALAVRGFQFTGQSR